MIKQRRSHELVAIKNKLFAIGGGENTCEVYDSCSKKFSLINSLKTNFKFNFENSTGAVSMGSKIIVFDFNTSFVACYDKNKEQWSEQLIEMDGRYNFYGCVKLPQF